MVFIVLIVICVALVIGVIVAAGSRDRYAEMTEEEFQSEAERASLLGAGVLGLQEFLQPKRVEYIMQRDKHVEADSTESGDRPPEEPPPAPKS